jgi:hypothetical protein
MFIKFILSKFNKILFVALSILIISNNPVNCKVVYTLIDSTLAGTVFMDAKQYYIDFNGDGINEFFLSHANQGMQEISWVCEIYSGTNSNRNEVLVVDNRIPVILSEGELIDANLHDWYNSYNGMSTMAMYFEAGWVGSGFHFVGLRFKINGRYHYGWVRVSIPGNSSNITVKDMAYEDDPEIGIIISEPSSVVSENLNESNPKIHIFGHLLIIESEEDSRCEFYNLIGSKIKDFELKEQTNYINLDEFNTGIYFLTLKSSGNTITKNFFVN